MANIAASDVTVTLLEQRKSANRHLNNVQLNFGDGSLTYGAGGVPLDIGKLGCPNIVESLTVYDKGTSGYSWSYDATNKKLVAFQSPAHSHNLLLKNAAVADGATTRVNAGANLLGANTGADLTIAGGGANGGVQLSTALAGSQPSTIAIAAQVLKCEVMGW
jgi:hypothetical protein